MARKKKEQEVQPPTEVAADQTTITSTQPAESEDAAEVTPEVIPEALETPDAAPEAAETPGEAEPTDGDVYETVKAEAPLPVSAPVTAKLGRKLTSVDHQVISTQLSRWFAGDVLAHHVSQVITAISGGGVASVWFHQRKPVVRINMDVSFNSGTVARTLRQKHNSGQLLMVLNQRVEDEAHAARYR